MIPEEIREYAQWIVWKYMPNEKGKLTKVPFSPHTGEMASVQRPLTWGTYEEACRVAYRYDGLGFMFTAQDPFIGIDIDHCIHDTVMTVEAKRMMKQIGSYTETSPSGNGIHIIGKGKLHRGHRGFRRGNIELYADARFFTVTGAMLLDVPIADI